jgi:CelD/BcsL family acetyltransferase involved in cellulose biosynthesis
MDLFSDNQAGKSHWPSIINQLPSPTYTYEWFHACAQAFHGEDDRCLITVAQSDQSRAVAPLFSLKKRGITWQEIMGVSILNEPGGLIYMDEDALRQLCHSIVRKGSPTLLGRLPANDLCIDTFTKLAKGRGLLLKIQNPGSPYVEIQSTWEDYFQRLSSRRRQDFRRARRRLCDHGEVSVDFVFPTQHNVDKLLEEAFRVEQANWKGENGSAINCRPDLKRFFTSYSHNICDARKLLISSLRLNGEMIAVQLLVEHANRWWILKIGFDERWAKYSPGMQLMFETIKEAFTRKHTAIELLGTQEQWINIWPHKIHQFISLVYFPFNPAGITALLTEAGSKFIARLHSRQ